MIGTDGGFDLACGNTYLAGQYVVNGDDGERSICWPGGMDAEPETAVRQPPFVAEPAERVRPRVLHAEVG